MTIVGRLTGPQRRRRRRERLFAFLSLLSLMLCLVTAGCWWQYLDPDGGHAIWLVPGPTLRPVFGTQTWAFWQGGMCSADPAGLRVGYVKVAQTTDSLDPHGSYRDWGGGTGFCYLPYWGDQQFAIVNRKRFSVPRSICGDCGVTVGDFGLGTRVILLEVPCPVVVVLLAVLPLAWVVRSDRQFRRRHRPRPAACLTCGYDLRASPDTCPECGEPSRSPPGPRTYTLGQFARRVVPARWSRAAGENVA